MSDQVYFLQEMYLAVMAEILQSIRQAEIMQILTKIQQSEGGTELLDVLMKYLYVRFQIFKPDITTKIV